MERLTKFDSMRGCYVMKPEVEQGKHIQKLGEYEEKDEARLVDFFGDKSEECCADCPACGCLLVDGCIGLPENYNFCPACGQRLKWVED